MVDELGQAANKMVSVLKDSLDIIIVPAKKASQGAIDRRNKKKDQELKHELERKDILHRAKIRVAREALRRQLNLESIGAKSLEYLETDASPEKMDIDWLHHFSTSAQDVSEEKLKDVWAKILAGEANKKGSFSRRTLDTLKNFSKEDCELFEKLSQYLVVVSPGGGFFLRSINYEDCGGGLDYGEILHLANIDILTAHDTINYFLESEEIHDVFYWGKRFNIKNKKTSRNAFNVYVLTGVGRELLKITNGKENEEFLEVLYAYFEKHNVEVIKS